MAYFRYCHMLLWTRLRVGYFMLNLHLCSFTEIDRLRKVINRLLSKQMFWIQ